jgi:signal transduction histidine kinase
VQQALAQRVPVELEHRIIRRDGTIGWTFLRAIPLLNEQGQITEWFGAASDITKRKQAAVSLKESDVRKDEFLALLAHELRNPMATLSNALLLLEATGGTDAGLPLAVVLPMMSREVAYLVRMVDDLLDVSRINLNKIELRRQRLALTGLVNQVQQVVHPLADQAGQQLRVHGLENDLYVEGDAIRLLQVLRNLLGNAIKFTPAGGVIDLYLERVDPQARLRVVDNGIGLAASELTRIFELFTQVNSSHASEQGGLGLGLMLVQTLVNLHGGQVEARSSGLGQGSEFSVYLPLVD